MKRRVVITGVGAITPIGIGKDEFWNNLVAGKSGVGPITQFDASEYGTRIAGEVKDFDFSKYGDKKEGKRMDRVTQFAVAAAKMAVEDAKLDIESIDPVRAGVCVGSGIGGMHTYLEQTLKFVEKGPSKISPFFIPMEIPNMPAGQISIALGFKGPNMAIVTACATGTHCVGEAFRIIQYGDADIMMAGGSEAAINPLAVAGFGNMKALSTNNEHPEKASCPFDKKRDGFVMGEGAGVLVLEELEHALKRGAHIYAEVAGYGMTADAYHITAPDPSGEMPAVCMELALVATGFPYDINQRVETILRRLKPILAAAQGVRRCGAASLDLVWTACGRFDAYYEDGLKPWDSAAGALILKEAGGQITDMHGKPYTLLSSVLASNSLLHDSLLHYLLKALSEETR